MSKYPKNPKKKIDSYGYHEASDRTYVAINILETSLGEHYVYEEHKKLKVELERIIADLADLYQVIGGLEALKDEEEKPSDNQ